MMLSFAIATTSPAADRVAPSAFQDAPALYFASADAVVTVAGKLVAARDWSTLARYYDLSARPDLTPASLGDGGFFLDAQASATGPAAISRWRQPFAPGAKFIAAKPVDESTALPRRWSLAVGLTIDQGGGPAQKVIWNPQLVQTDAGFQLLPPPATVPSPAPTTDAAWQARGADAVLLYRPALRARAEQEIPAGRAANIPDLVRAIERLKPLAAAHAGATRAGAPPLEPATVYTPTDEELLLSLAGDRIWRTLQLAPPGTVAGMRRAHPDFSTDRIEYPHLEIVRVDAAGSGPRVYAQPPLVRPLILREASP